MQRRAQSRGLWTSGDVEPTAPTAQPRPGALPRAVVGTPSPTSPANTNYRSPTIGHTDSQPAAAQPLAASTQPAAHALSESDSSDARTRDAAAKDPSLSPADAMDGDTLEILANELRGKPQPEAARLEPLLKGAQTSPPNTTVWLALILIAAVVAMWFIGAAIGLWSLPWGKSATGRNLNKAIPAKSMPEMHAATPQAPPAVAPGAPADPITLTATPQPDPSAEAPAPEATTAQPSAAVIAANEAAPLRAPTLSGTNLDDLLDMPSNQVAPTLTAARAELKAGRPKEAEALLRPLLETYPDDHHVAEALAQALLARGAAVEAVGFAQKIVKKHPKRASYRVLLGDALRRAGDEPSAKLAYRDALALDPKLREAQRRLKNRKLGGTP